MSLRCPQPNSRSATRNSHASSCRTTAPSSRARSSYAPTRVSFYFIVEEGRAIRYPVGVGRAGKQWQGRAEIDGKHVNPAWSPPEEVLRDNPRLPPVYPGGSPENPMGPRALTLSGGEGYAIHGTSRPHSIGTFASYGCIRMFNEDILDLFERVKVGTEVLVTL